MKKYLAVILLLFSFAAQSQTIRILTGLKNSSPDSLRPGWKYIDTVYNLSNTTNKYFTGFGTWGSLPDSTIKLITATSPIFYNNSTYVISSQAASGSQNGYLTSTDWTTFNSKEPALGNPSVSGYVLSSTTGGVRSWIAAAGGSVTAVTGSGNIASSGGTAPNITFTGVLPIANGGTNNGSLSVTNGNFIYADGSKLISLTAATAAGKHLISTGAATYSWVDTAVVSGSSGWALAGNTVTAGVDKFGSTNNTSVNMFANNVKRMFLDSARGVFIDSVYFGRGLGKNAIIAGRNLAIGDSALNANNQTGNYNTAIGDSSLRVNSTGSGNTAIGSRALSNNTTGTNNMALGAAALNANTTGNTNVAIGQNSLLLNTTGIQNVAIGGSQVLGSNTTGHDNVSIGINNMNGGTGNNNVAIGQSNLSATTTGSNNTAIGWNILSTGSDNTDNTGVGDQILHSITTGDNNTGMGYANMYATTTGADNIGIGDLGLRFNTTGGQNIAMGLQPLYYNIAGSNNIAIGNYPGKNILGGSGATGQATSVTNSILIGDSVRVNGDFQKHQIVIGNNVTGGGSFTTTLGDSLITNTTVYGNLTLAMLGNKIIIPVGTNGSVGTATLSGGTVTVSTTAVTANSKIFLTDATTGALTNIGTPTVGTIVAGTSFVINSSNVLDASNVNWFIIN